MLPAHTDQKLGPVMTSVAKTKKASPNVSYWSISLLRRLHQQLVTLSAQAAHQSPWIVPELFFFNSRLQAEWQEIRAESPRKRCLNNEIRVLLEDAVLLLHASSEVRIMARALPGFPECVDQVASQHPLLQELADLMMLIDNEVICVVDPQTGISYRFYVTGIFNWAEFTRHLADFDIVNLQRARPIDTARQHLRLVHADVEENCVRTHLQLYDSRVFDEFGMIPSGYAGNRYWLWPEQPIRSYQSLHGEKRVVIGPAVLKGQQRVEQRLPRLQGSLRMISKQDLHHVSVHQPDSASCQTAQLQAA